MVFFGCIQNGTGSLTHYDMYDLGMQISRQAKPEVWQAEEEHTNPAQYKNDCFQEKLLTSDPLYFPQVT